MLNVVKTITTNACLRFAKQTQMQQNQIKNQQALCLYKGFVRLGSGPLKENPGPGQKYNSGPPGRPTGTSASCISKKKGLHIATELDSGRAFRAVIFKLFRADIPHVNRKYF